MAAFAQEFRTLIEEASGRLLAIDDEASAVRPAPGSWSPREVVGHLIDSASNNHGRFVRGQTGDDLVFPGYDQTFWVAAQRYQDADWRSLVQLWRAFNLHLAHVMAVAPGEVRHRPHSRHNFDAIALDPVSAQQPATLQYLMEDYIRHVRHHLAQIPGALPTPKSQLPTPKSEGAHTSR